MKIPRRLKLLVSGFVGLAAWSTATSPASAAQQPEIVTVVVQPGDTLWELGKQYNSPHSAGALSVLNGVDPKALKVGSALVITTCGSMAPVIEGSTLVHIAETAQTPIELLVSLNSISDPSFIMAGTCLLLDAAVNSAPAPHSDQTPVKKEQSSEIAGKVDKSSGNGPDIISLEALNITESTQCNGAPLDKVRIAYTFFRIHGLSRSGSAFLVGNLCQESTLRVDAVGDGGSAAGLAQWTGGRQDGMPEVNAPYEDHLAFVLIEMERDGARNGHNVLNDLHGDDIAAIKQGLKRWERYGVEGRRFIYGQSILDAVSSVPAVQPQAAPVDVPAVTNAPVPLVVQRGVVTQSPTAKLDQSSMTVHAAEGVTTIDIDGIPVNIEIADKLISMIDAAKSEGVVLTLLSGFRSIEKQRQVGATNGCPVNWTDWRQCEILPTAPPSKSRHTKGVAVDFDSYDVNWLEKNAKKFGFYNFTGEPWHWSIDGH